ncbi:MAG TPA: hypothetical protein DDW31_04890, partial [candidate division Zixibacteria bacterium]|nr:hypothetical protein [candidate division Zixibacteria bacterium]
MEGDGAGHWRYRILGPLGEGGASKVYRALDLATGSEVALKTADGATAVSLKMEYARLHRLRHPGLVRALDFHRAGGRAFLSLELLEAPVPAVISGPGGIRPAMETWAALASVLRHLHGNGLVHGDIKPENVRFSDGAAKLIDLGLAGSPRQTGRPGFAGTPACAAPEALQRGEVSPAGDVYGLGLLVWEMLGGIGPGPELKLDPGERWLEDMPPGLAPAAGEMLRAMLRCRPLDRVRDGVQLAWAMAEAGLMPDQALAAEMPFCGRRRELRQALAACRQGAGLIVIRARPGTGGTRFLEELKFLLQLAGSEAVMAGKGRGRSLERAPPGCFVLREGEAELPEGGGRRIVELAAGPEEDAGTPTVLLRGLGSGDYREMLGRLLQGAYPEDLENLAGWLEEQAGGHVKTAAALLDALIRRRLVYPERIHWVADWQGILALDAGAAVEDVWAGRWEALAESQRSRLKGLALAGKAPAGGEGTGLALAEWTRSGEGGLRFAGEAVRGLAAGRCTGEECAAAAGRGGMGEPSPALLRACLKAGDAEAWLAHCRTLLLRASEGNDREAALRYSMLLADSGLLAGDELRTEVIRAAGLCRSLARYRPGLELLERRWGELGGGWELFKTAILLRLAAGQPGPAAESARQAIESLSGAGREAVEARLFLGLASAAAGGLEQGEEIVLEAAKEAAASGDKALRMQAEERLASLAHRAGDWEAVVRHSRAGLELAG